MTESGIDTVERDVSRRLSIIMHAYRGVGAAPKRYRVRLGVR